MAPAASGSPREACRPAVGSLGARTPRLFPLDVNERQGTRWFPGAVTPLRVSRSQASTACRRWRSRTRRRSRRARTSKRRTRRGGDRDGSTASRFSSHTGARTGRRQWVDGSGRLRAGGNVLAHAAGLRPAMNGPGPKPGAQNDRGGAAAAASSDGAPRALRDASSVTQRQLAGEATPSSVRRRPEPGSVPGPRARRGWPARVGSLLVSRSAARAGGASGR